MLFRFCTVGLLSLGCIEAVEYGNNHDPVERDNDLVAANFQDVDGYELISPAFTNPETVSAGFANGTAGPTSDEEVEKFLKSIASRNDWIKYDVADYLSEEGRSFTYLLLSSPTQSSTSSSNSSNKLRLWFQGGVHGDEPAGDQSLLALVGKMDANQTWAQEVLETMGIMILPRYNLDGVAYFQRTLASNFEPNRDHIKLARQQTKDIKITFNEFAPHIALDMHEFDGPTVYGDSYVRASDAVFSSAKNLNINSDIRQMSEDLFTVRIGAALGDVGLRWEPYISDVSNSTDGSLVHFAQASSDAKIGRNALGLTQSITFLCETRGVGMADQHFQRRTVAGLVVAEAIIQTAADNAEQVHQTITEGIEDFINSDDDIVISDYSTDSDRTFRMGDIANGSLVEVPVQFASTTPTRANLTPARPAAYIIPRAWADPAARLEISGLEVTTMPDTFKGTVEALNITTVSFDSNYYEGVLPLTVTTSTTEKEIQLPAGSFSTSTKQRYAGLAFVALEPENIDSYVAFNIVPVGVGDEYPIYRVMA